MEQHPAKQFFIQKWNDKKHKIHCQAVIDTCIGVIKKTNINKDIFIVAGWIHDMGKLDNKKLHHEYSLSYLNEFLLLYPTFKELESVLIDCIQNHRTDGKPLTIEGKLFQIADKIALQNTKWVSFLEKNN